MRLAPLFTLLMIAAPLTAQGPGGGMGGPGGMGAGGTRGRPYGRRPVEPPSEDLIRGPYEPDSLIPKFQLDTAQGARYRVSWDSMMAATRPVRDSVHASRDSFRRAQGEGFSREGARQQEVMQHLVKRLQKEEGRFDKVMRHILTDDQWGDFKDCRKRRRETERELRDQQQMEGGFGPSGGRRGRP